MELQRSLIIKQKADIGLQLELMRQPCGLEAYVRQEFSPIADQVLDDMKHDEHYRQTIIEQCQNSTNQAEAYIHNTIIDRLLDYLDTLKIGY